MQEQTLEIVQFLQHSNPEVRYQASTYLTSITANDDPHTRNLLIDNEGIPLFMRLLGDVEPVAKQVLTCLVNLSEHREVVIAMLKKDAVQRIVNSIIDDEDSQLIELRINLLSNITIHMEGCSDIVQKGTQTEGYLVNKLVSAFARDGKKYGGLARVLQNLTQLPEGRLLFLNSGMSLLLPMLPAVSHPEESVRLAVIGLLRNCCFVTASHDWLFNKADVLTLVAGPLRGPDPLSEEDTLHMPSGLINPRTTRESSAECRKLLLETLVLLTAERTYRERLRECKLYPILRAYDKWENDEANSLLIIQLVEVLINDEAPEEPESITENNTGKLEHEIEEI